VVAYIFISWSLLVCSFAGDVEGLDIKYSSRIVEIRLDRNFVYYHY